MVLSDLPIPANLTKRRGEMPPCCVCSDEHWGKQANDKPAYGLISKRRSPTMDCNTSSSSTWVEGAIIVGAGPAGMATAACLQRLGVCGSVILEKSQSIASLWQERTYDRLRLHLPKQCCELPFAPFPAHFPTYPTRAQFLGYLHQYARDFNIQPRFNEQVEEAMFQSSIRAWRVRVTTGDGTSKEYVARWLVVATGENAEARLPLDLPGMSTHLEGKFVHSSQYKNGAKYKGQRVLVVGCGNSGMEIALDLVEHQAEPSIVVRSPVHILPREVLGKSTFSVATMLLGLLPVWLTDQLLVMYATLVLGDTANYGIKRPKHGPMEIKAKLGKSPVLDVGTLSHIKNGKIKIEPAIERFTPTGAKFVNGECRPYDSVVFATGYKCNVPKWLKEPELDYSVDGFPKCGWRAANGLYMAGLSRKGLLGVSRDAQLTAQDIQKAYFNSSITKS